MIFTNTTYGKYEFFAFPSLAVKIPSGVLADTSRSSFLKNISHHYLSHTVFISFDYQSL